MFKNISLSVGMHETCNERCAMEDTCVSINIGPPINDKVLCQLSDSDHMRHPGDLKPKEGFTYKGTEVTHLSMNCYFCYSMLTRINDICCILIRTHAVATHVYITGPV